MNKIIKIIIIVGIILISLSISYYYLIYKPQQKQLLQKQQEQLVKEQESLRLREQKFKEKEKYLNNCLYDADNKYTEQWANWCGQPGYYFEPKTGMFELTVPSCSLPLAVADRFEKSRQIARNECYKKVDTLFQ